MDGPSAELLAPRLRYDFDGALSYHVIRTWMAYQRVLDAKLAGHGITYRQFQVVAWIKQAGGVISQAELARRMGIEPPSMVGLIDRMQAAGWVVRESDGDDRRKKRLRAGPAAEAAWAVTVEALLAVRAEATARLEPGQRETLLDLLRTVAQTLGESNPGDA